MNAIHLALDSLFTRYINLSKSETGNAPRSQFEPPWPSPCEFQQDIDGTNQTCWEPQKRENYELFKNLESGFEFTFPQEIKWYYGSFWSNGICVEHKELPFNLIQIWNQEDEEQLKENMLGHVFAKLKNKQPISYFIGCTDGNDVVTLDHESGQICVEKPGQKSHQVLGESLESVLLSLSPTLDEY